MNITFNDYTNFGYQPIRGSDKLSNHIKAYFTLQIGNITQSKACLLFRTVSATSKPLTQAPPRRHTRTSRRAASQTFRRRPLPLVQSLSASTPVIPPSSSTEVVGPVLLYTVYREISAPVLFSPLSLSLSEGEFITGRILCHK